MSENILHNQLFNSIQNLLFSKLIFNKMQGDQGLNRSNNHQRSNFNGQMESSKLIDEKDRQIKNLEKIIKKLTKQLKQKNSITDTPKINETNSSHYKILLQRECSRFNELKDIVFDVTDRMKRIAQQINQEFSLSQTNESMENLVKMLENHNISSSHQERSFYGMSSNSSVLNQQQIQIQQAMDVFQIIVKNLTLKYGQSHKLYHETLLMKKQIEDEVVIYRQELKDLKRSQDLMQKLLEKNQNQRNQLINQITNIANQKDIQLLKTKKKQDILQYCFKLTYRINDLEKEKQELIKSSTNDKQKQMFKYQQLWTKLKDIKERSRIRQSVA